MINEKIARTELNLQRKLDWIGRSDTRIAFAASVSVTMLGVLANIGADVKAWDLKLLVFFVTTGMLLLGSLISIWLSQYPKTRSVNSSLIYFGTIAELRADEFKTKFKASTDDEYLDDLLSQTHKNAEILNWKFKYLKIALIFIFISIAPWLLSIYFSNIYIK